MAAARRHLEEVLVKNVDYIALNETLDELEEVREVLRKQIERLYVTRDRALEDPEGFVNDLQEGKLDLPKPVHVPLVPTIDFGKYNLSEEEQAALAAVASDDEDAASEPLSASRADTRSAASPESLSGSLPTPGDVVRGRVYEPDKPTSFNQLWTDEEQTRLERLLEVYGEEEVAAHRWTKIARALGNRTPKQVASRTQKYFQKLTRLGLPLPGAKKGSTLGKRDAPLSEQDSPPSAKRQQTSGPEEEGEEEGAGGRAMVAGTSASSYYAPPPVLMPDGLGDDAAPNERVVHLGFKCDGCGCEPIVGVRYRCTVCDEVDLCGACQERGWEGAQHAHTHSLDAVRVAESPFAADPLFDGEVGDGSAGSYLDPTLAYPS